jgi:hypothetical protein|tara:strand:- start:264 stop:494 length:231 start_codon:yes stop_codon:yes gene_type:complete
MYDEFDDYDPLEEMDWYVQLNMGIDELRMFYSHICYAIETWPGAPRRPYEEQEYLKSLKYKTYAMLLEYQRDQGNL